MRDSACALGVYLVLLAASPASAAPNRAVPVVACPSLANLRLLIQRSGDAAAAVLADAKADHLGCILLERDLVLSVPDRVALGGRAYECLAIHGTSVCHWTIAGSVTPAVQRPSPKAAAPAEKPRR